MKQLFCAFSFLFFILCSCKDSEEENIELRSSSISTNYSINNKEAALRLSSIMYNKRNEGATERFKIVHISDAHLASYSNSNHYKNPGNLLEAVRFANQKDLRINALVATGDHISYEKRSIALQAMNSFFYNLYKNNTIPTFHSFGNHDQNLADEKLTAECIFKEELYTLFDNKNNYSLHRAPNENYYYADVANPMGGTIRFIAIDMIDHKGLEYNSLHEAYYSQKQIDWFCDVALKENMSDSHHVIILSHFPFEAASATTKTFLINGFFVNTSRMIPEIVEAFRDKRKLNEKFPNVIKKGDSIAVSTDFSSSKGDFICHLGGHIHATAQFEITNVKNKSTAFPPQKMLLCTNMSSSSAGGVFNRVKREAGTTTDNAFCMYAIDTRERNIYITFFGAYLPSDKTKEEYPEVQVINY